LKNQARSLARSLARLWRLALGAWRLALGACCFSFRKTSAQAEGRPSFSPLARLKALKIKGGIGSIYINPSLNKVNFSVDSKKDLTNLIIHLEKYPLLTQCL
jgi:hypothetical protein